MHYSLHAQYDFISKNKNLKIRPLVLLQSTQGIPFVYEGNLLFSLKINFILILIILTNIVMDFLVLYC